MDRQVLEAVEPLLREQPLKRCIKRIIDDQWDVEAWSKLLGALSTVDPQNEDVRKVFVAFLDLYPTAVSQSLTHSSVVLPISIPPRPSSLAAHQGYWWQKLADRDIKAGRNEEAERVLAKALNRCRQIAIWMTYIEFIQTTKVEPARAEIPKEGAIPADIQRKVLRAEDEMRKALEFALQRVGLWLWSHEIWRFYLSFEQATLVSSSSFNAVPAVLTPFLLAFPSAALLLRPSLKTRKAKSATVCACCTSAPLVFPWITWTKSGGSTANLSVLPPL